MSATEVKLLVNGRPETGTQGMTITQLLEKHGLRPEWVVVEHNGEALPRGRYAEMTLDEGDRIEVVRAVAGGAV
jgi:thiamine biosynthesis protein ThiS